MSNPRFFKNEPIRVEDKLTVGERKMDYTELMRLGVACDRARLAMHQAELALQEDVSEVADAAYYDAVTTLVNLEARWETLSTILG